VSDPKQPDTTPRLPENDLHVDFGEPAPGSSNPMPVEVTLAYEQRILCSVEAQVAGAQRGLHLFVG
jgi:hypothetical protein